MIERPTHTYIAKTLMNFEELLADELDALGATDIEILNRAVKFTGDKEVMYKANYYCRTALRILQPITTFNVTNQQELYDKVKAVKWEEFFTEKQTFAFDTTETKSEFTNSLFVSMKAKDAVADRFRELKGIRPYVDKEFPDMRINIHIFRESATLSLDTSGTSLHKRGYRTDSTKAPINEVLSAGLIMMTKWDKKSLFVDPMCGSGTNLIEAAMMAYNMPAGYHRKEYGFENWLNFDPILWNEIRAEGKANIRTEGPEIVGIDSATSAAIIAKGNIKSADLGYKIKVITGAFEEYKHEYEKGTMMINPPYGERLDKDNLDELYQLIGDTLKKNFKGFDAFVLSSNMEAMKKIGLKPKRRYNVMNGSLECKFNHYEMFAGTRKDYVVSRL